MTLAQNNIDKKRILKNTLMLYFRQIFIMCVQLYTVRAVLNILGVEDYGILNVIAGFVTLLSFLNSTMSSATQRFFSFALGKRDLNFLNSVCKTNFVIYIGMIFIAIIFLETLGLWFIHSKLNIPAERFQAAQLLYQFVVLRFISSFIASLCIAALIAHEDINVYAGISVLEATTSLLTVIILPYGTVDKLPLFGFLSMLSSFFITGIYSTACIKRYAEFSLKNFQINKKLLREIFDYTGWTLFGCISTVIRTQAITVMLNQFFNPAVIAARAIALNISGAINTFSSNFNTGLYPPIIKAWSSENKEEMFHLVYSGCKIAFFLTWIFALPFFLEMNFVLNFWLKSPPPDAVLFTRLILIESVILAISLPLATAARAPGKMRCYELTLGSIQILIFPISWLWLKFGGGAHTTLVVAITANIIMFFVRLFIVRKLTGLSIRCFVKLTLKPVVLSSAISLILSLIVKVNLPAGMWWSLTTIAASGILTIVSIWSFGIDFNERQFVLRMLKNKLSPPKNI